MQIDEIIEDVFKITLGSRNSIYTIHIKKKTKRTT